MDSLRDYLLAVAEMRAHKPKGFYYSGIEDFLLQHGETFTPQKLPKVYHYGKMKDCYRNSALLALDNEELTYVEGYGLSIIPTLHAWCVDKDNNVVDLTWRWGIGKYNQIVPGALIGVKFSMDLLRNLLIKHNHFGFLDDWKCGFPILTTSWKETLKLKGE